MSKGIICGTLFSAIFAITSNMNRLIIFTFVVCLAQFGMAQTPAKTVKELEWKTWNEGFSLAQKTNKIAIIDVYTDWCHWCKVMDKNTYTDDSVINLINEHFIPIKFNPEKSDKYYVESDTIDGRSLLNALSGGQSSGYPTTYFFLPGTNQIFQQPGYIEPKQFYELLENVVAKSKK
jgi:uncharacterized protein YyaL (SSP411 family)